MKFTKNIGTLLLAIYLIVRGVAGIGAFDTGLLLPVLAIAAGVFILIGK